MLYLGRGTGCRTLSADLKPNHFNNWNRNPCPQHLLLSLLWVCPQEHCEPVWERRYFQRVTQTMSWFLGSASSAAPVSSTNKVNVTGKLWSRSVKLHATNPWCLCLALCPAGYGLRAALLCWVPVLRQQPRATSSQTCSEGADFPRGGICCRAWTYMTISGWITFKTSTPLLSVMCRSPSGLPHVYMGGTSNSFASNFFAFHKRYFCS